LIDVVNKLEEEVNNTNATINNVPLWIKQSEYYNFAQSNNISKLNNDIPFFYTLNQKVNQFISQKVNLVLKLIYYNLSQHM
jgi:hypothetical protein